jgi:hypothetical protein
MTYEAPVAASSILNCPKASDKWDIRMEKLVE